MAMGIYRVYSFTIILDLFYLDVQLYGQVPLILTHYVNTCSCTNPECYIHAFSRMLITGPSSTRLLSITRVLQDGIELNWLPPTEPNGEVHYVIYYTPEGGTEQSVDTGSNLTHYNLTGLERNRVYTNIEVQAVNSVGRSDRSSVIAQYNHSQTGESWCMIMHTYSLVSTST